MAQITFIEHGGTEHHVDVPNGLSIMDGAKRFTIPGIDGDCGGACACATCHVYVDAAWADRGPPREGLGEARLDFSFEVTPDSRLGCQIKVEDSLNGLIVRTPARQY